MNIFAITLLVSALFVVTGCSSGTPSSIAAASVPLKPGIVVLATHTATDSLAFPTVFEAAFRPGTTVRQDTATYTFAVAELGQLTSETGKIIAGDPIVLADRAAFTQRFPVGRFPVQLALAKTAGDERVGFARILFSNSRVANWQLALLPGQKPLALKNASFYCYGVDAGMGAFLDSAANRRFAAKGQAIWESVFIKKAEQPGYQGYIYNFDGGNLATFTTGFGDGCYATYIGFDAKGDVCRLLTDFGLVVW